MKQYEFKIINSGNAIYRLNDLGKEGWAVVGVIPPGGEPGEHSDSRIILQRVIAPKEPELCERPEEKECPECLEYEFNCKCYHHD
jgi:hypothetical protein